MPTPRTYQTEAVISDEIASLSTSGITSESIETFPSLNFGVSFEPRKYSYILTELGKEIAEIVEKQNKDDANKIKQILNDTKEAGASNDYKSLSVAAKMFHILKPRKRMRPSQILDEAKALDWSITEDEAKASIEFLKKMSLNKIEAPLTRGNISLLQKIIISCPERRRTLPLSPEETGYSHAKPSLLPQVAQHRVSDCGRHYTH